MTRPDWSTPSAVLNPCCALVKNVDRAPADVTRTTVVPVPCALLTPLKFENSTSPGCTMPVVGNPAGTTATPYGFPSAGPVGGTVERTFAAGDGVPISQSVRVAWLSLRAAKTVWPAMVPTAMPKAAPLLGSTETCPTYWPVVVSSTRVLG